MDDIERNELLRLASISVGPSVVVNHGGNLRELRPGSSLGPTWDPFVNAGQALRLAVKLGICIINGYDDVLEAYVLSGNYTGNRLHNTVADIGLDDVAATLSVIVKCAAKIGAKKEAKLKAELIKLDPDLVKPKSPPDSVDWIDLGDLSVKLEGIVAVSPIKRDKLDEQEFHQASFSITYSGGAVVWAITGFYKERVHAWNLAVEWRKKLLSHLSSSLEG